MSDRSTGRTTNKFTEKDTQHFYDREDAHYRRFWDKAGSLHWGVFDKSTGDDFLKACANLNAIMARECRLDERSHVVDLGCGNGNTSTWLAKSKGCRVVGVDLSGVRVKSAEAQLKQEEPSIQERVRFLHASIASLPSPDESFTHAWSQASIYHVPDKDKALSEAFRVLKPGGRFVFDDLIKPKPDVSDEAKEVVYDRLLFDTDYSFESYRPVLEQVGFEVTKAVDLSKHLATSYVRLAEMTGKITGEDITGEEQQYFETLTFVYRRMVECIRARDVGWAMYVCKKPAKAK